MVQLRLMPTFLEAIGCGMLEYFTKSCRRDIDRSGSKHTARAPAADGTGLTVKGNEGVHRRASAACMMSGLCWNDSMIVVTTVASTAASRRRINGTFCGFEHDCKPPRKVYSGPPINTLIPFPSLISSKACSASWKLTFLLITSFTFTAPLLTRFKAVW